MDLVAFRFQIKFRRFILLFNMTTPAISSNCLWVPHRWSKTPITMHIAMAMTTGTHHPGGDVYIQIALFTIKSEGQPFPAMTGKTGIHISGFFSLKKPILRAFLPDGPIHR